jgi:hypothetical protein
VGVSYFAVWLLAELSKAKAGSPPLPITHPVPGVNASPAPLASVLHLTELSNRHGTECEELQHVG